MDVLLLNPPYVKYFMRNARCEGVSISGTQWYPIWLGYCGALLEREGHNVKLVDAPPENLTPEQVLEKAKKLSPDLTLLYSSTRSLKDDSKLADEIKSQTGSRIVYAGPWVTIDTDAVMNSSDEIDYVAYGEFDYTIRDLAAGKNSAEIEGLMWRRNGKIVKNKPRPPIPEGDLDSFPFVTEFYSRNLDFRNYHVVAQKHPFIDMFTGRGCVWGMCTFCLWVNTLTEAGVYRHRSASNVVEEMRWVKENLPQIKEQFFQDDMLPGWWADEISEEVIRQKLDVTWGCYAKGDLKLETMEKMKKAGCRVLHVGYESADPTILKNIRKGITRETMERFTKDAKKAGLEIHADFVVGLPGETEETIKNTVNWANSLDVETIQYSIPVITKAAPMYAELNSRGCLKNGEVSYPHMSNEEIREWAKRGVRSYYLRPKYMLRTLRNPGELEHILSAARYALPAMFWKKW
ncbi:MAG: radical SAM protein [Candidatus Altiarchaeota archaeon]